MLFHSFINFIFLLTNLLNYQITQAGNGGSVHNGGMSHHRSPGQYNMGHSNGRQVGLTVRHMILYVLFLFIFVNFRPLVFEGS